MHLPIERQVKEMRSQGLVDIEGRSLIEQTHRLADFLKPLYGRIKGETLEARVLGADESWWRMMERSPRKRWWLWGFFTPKAAFYSLNDSRSKDSANEILKDSKAKYLIVDGYTGYNAPSKAKGIKIANCWAHCRRKFKEAALAFPEANEMVDLIGELYAVEQQAADFTALHQIRQTKSKEILDRIREWVFTHHALPKSALGKAIEYLQEYWVGLTVFLEDPEIYLDNNASERGLRGPVVGRKNHYGNHSPRGAETAAILYTVCESAKLNGLDPRQYLKNTVREMLSGMAPTTPAQYASRG